MIFKVINILQSLQYSSLKKLSGNVKISNINRINTFPLLVKLESINQNDTL